MTRFSRDAVNKDSDHGQVLPRRAGNRSTHSRAPPLPSPTAGHPPLRGRRPSLPSRGHHAHGAHRPRPLVLDPRCPGPAKNRLVPAPQLFKLFKFFKLFKPFKRFKRFCTARCLPRDPSRCCVMRVADGPSGPGTGSGYRAPGTLWVWCGEGLPDLTRQQAAATIAPPRSNTGREAGVEDDKHRVESAGH